MLPRERWPCNAEYSSITRSHLGRPGLGRVNSRGGWRIIPHVPPTFVQAARPFTKPPLLQERRLTGGGSPNLVDLVERKVPVERKTGATRSFHSF